MRGATRRRGLGAAHDTAAQLRGNPWLTAAPLARSLSCSFAPLSPAPRARRETWNPVWSVSSILVGVQSFLVDTAPTAGSVESDEATKRDLAAKSLDWNIKNNKDFVRLFPKLVDLRATQLAAAAAASAGAGSSSSSSSSTSASSSAAAAPPPLQQQQQRGGGGGGGGGGGALLGGGNALALLALVAVVGAGLVLHLLTDGARRGGGGDGDSL